jgi:hypothetical protein
MWVAAVVLTIVAVSAITLAIGRRTKPEAKILPWDIPKISGTYTSIVGSLSGFAVASSIFIANLRVSHPAPEFEAVIGLFLAGFVLLVGTAMMFGTVPNHPDLASGRSQPGSTQLVVYTLANINYYLGISSTWFALRPLLLAIDLPMAASIFTWILLFVAVAGGSRIGMFVYRLTRFGSPVVFLIPAAAFGMTTVYRLVLVPLVPGLWPSESPSLALMMVLFVIAAIGFSASTLLLQRLSSHESTQPTRLARQDRLLAFTQAAACSVAFLWWAVIMP